MNTKTKTVEVVEENMDAAERTGRKAARTYLGLLGMIYDESMNLFERARELVSQAEDRGQEVEMQTREEVERYYQRAQNQLQELRQRFNSMRSKTMDNIDEMTPEGQIETQIEKLFTQMGIPSREDINRLGKRVDELTREIDAKLLKTTSPAVLDEPFKGYKKLTVREVNERLKGLTMRELTAVKQYEMAHENRVTILREVNQRLEKMPIARYDELTVDEIVPLLNTLDAEQLAYLKTYEKAHQNRVTLIEPIENELQERPLVTA